MSCPFPNCTGFVWQKFLIVLFCQRQFFSFLGLHLFSKFQLQSALFNVHWNAVLCCSCRKLRLYQHLQEAIGINPSLQKTVICKSNKLEIIFRASKLLKVTGNSPEHNISSGASNCLILRSYLTLNSGELYLNPACQQGSFYQWATGSVYRESLSREIIH